MAPDRPIPGVSFRFFGEGELGPLVRGKDWSQTPLGPFDAWPQTLKGYVSMVLAMPAPAIIFWGPEQVQIYNDGYAVIMGPRHPKHLGSTYRECWPDTYPTIYPWMQRVLRGEVVEVERTLIPLTRYGFNEEAFFTFTFSPLRDDRGEIAGFLQIVFEVTAAVLADRRAETLRALAPSVTSPSMASSAAILDVLSRNASDLPVALYWRPLAPTQEPQLTFQGATGADVARLPQPGLARVHEIAARVFHSNVAEEVEDLQRLAPGLTGGPWPEPVRRAIFLPIGTEGAKSARGVILLGISPRLRFDDAYRSFLRAVSYELAALLSAEQERFLADQLALVLDSANMGTWRIDLRTRRILVLDRTASFLGLSGAREQELAEINAQHVHPDDLERVDRALNTAIETHGLYSAEYRVIRVDRAVRWLRSWGRAIYDAKGTPLMVPGVTLDVTEQVESRQRIEKLVDELGEAVRARDEFISIASHELKTPLSSLKLQTQTMQRAMARNDPSVFSPERVKKLVDSTERQTTRLTRLVNDMLDVGRISTGKLPVRRVRTDLGKLVQETSERLRPQFEAAGIPLQVVSGAQVLSDVDPDRIEQVLVNLLTNALRYGKRTPVEVTVEARGEVARISVRDLGPGIAKQDQPRIFERFERAISASEVSGLGLGLFISRQIVESHRGKIWVESELNEGATFVVELPLAGRGSP